MAPKKNKKDESIKFVDGTSSTSAGNSINVSGTCNYIHTGSLITPGGSMTTSSYVYPQYNKKLHDTKFIETDEGNFIEITYYLEQVGGYITYTTTGLLNSSPKQKVLKEIYGISKGKLQLINTISGIENPGYWVEPDIEWEE